VLGLIVMAQFMVVLDIAIVNVALPSIKTDLHFSQVSLQWVITPTRSLRRSPHARGAPRRPARSPAPVRDRPDPLHGQLAARRFGLERGVPHRVPLAAGLGAALLSPALSILITTFKEGRERNLALGVWGAVSGSGGAAGVLLGGALTSGFGWSWIFFINVPVGIAVIATTPFLLRESHGGLSHRTSIWPVRHRSPAA